MFPSNCRLILMANYSFWMASCKTCWVPNSSWMVNYSFSMANYTNGLVKSSWMVNCMIGWGKNSLTVDYSFWMVSYRNGLVRNFWMARKGRV